MTTNQFFSKWTEASWVARQKSLDGLKKEVTERSNPNWNDRHYAALEVLIKQMESYQNFTPDIN